MRRKQKKRCMGMGIFTLFLILGINAHTICAEDVKKELLVISNEAIGYEETHSVIEAAEQENSTVTENGNIAAYIRYAKKSLVIKKKKKDSVINFICLESIGKDGKAGDKNWYYSDEYIDGETDDIVIDIASYINKGMSFKVYTGINDQNPITVVTTQRGKTVKAEWKNDEIAFYEDGEEIAKDEVEYRTNPAFSWMGLNADANGYGGFKKSMFEQNGATIYLRRCPSSSSISSSYISDGRPASKIAKIKLKAAAKGPKIKIKEKTRKITIPAQTEYMEFMVNGKVQETASWHAITTNTVLTYEELMEKISPKAATTCSAVTKRDGAAAVIWFRTIGKDGRHSLVSEVELPYRYEPYNSMEVQLKIDVKYKKKKKKAEDGSVEFENVAVKYLLTNDDTKEIEYAWVKIGFEYTGQDEEKITGWKKLKPGKTINTTLQLYP